MARSYKIGKSPISSWTSPDAILLFVHPLGPRRSPLLFISIIGHAPASKPLCEVLSVFFMSLIKCYVVIEDFPDHLFKTAQLPSFPHLLLPSFLTMFYSHNILSSSVKVYVCFLIPLGRNLGRDLVLFHCIFGTMNSAP